MIKEYERVVLTTDLPEYGLQGGNLGVVVHIYKDGEACEIEFFALDGETLDVVTVEGDPRYPVGLLTSHVSPRKPPI